MIRNHIVLCQNKDTNRKESKDAKSQGLLVIGAFECLRNSKRLSFVPLVLLRVCEDIIDERNTNNTAISIEIDALSQIALEGKKSKGD